MIRNYFKTALRNLLRNKSNSFINIAGLSVGFAAFLLIFLVIGYQESFDDFHTNKDNIYRVVRIGRSHENREYRTGVPFPVTQALRTDFPQLINAGAIISDANVQVIVPAGKAGEQKRFKERQVFAAEKNFFEMFGFKLAGGDSKTALNEVNTLLLTKDAAVKYFGRWELAMGKTVKLYGDMMKVTGILENPPVNTDFPLSVVVSYATVMKNPNTNNWGGISDENYCFVQLGKNSSVQQLNAMLNRFTDKHIKPVNPGYFLSAQPLNELHSDGRYGNFNYQTFSRELVAALSIIGSFLLIIACVNFINITTAQAVNRSREVGVRKVLGSRRTQLVIQFLGETGITTFVALLCAVVLVLLCLPLVNALLNTHISAMALGTMQFVLGIMAAFLAVTFFSGFYPALVLSGFKPINVLTNRSESSVQGVDLRRGLVLFQFVIAQVLIIGTLVVASQMDYFRTADMGFARNAIITAGIPGDSVSRTKTDAFYNDIKNVPGVKEISLSMAAPVGGGSWATDLRTGASAGKPEPDMVVTMKPADTAFFKLYNLQLVAGRVYFSSDTVREYVVNETVVRNLGIQKPQQAVGKMINVSGRMFPIVGVVKDFHINSLRDAMSPVVMTTLAQGYSLANVKIDMNKAESTIAALKSRWNIYYPDFVFEYNFIDQAIADYYQQENQLTVLYKIFSGIAIFISCLGLYGLISFMALQRRKEIGIRKVLGAPVRDIVVMLSKEFTVLIGIAFVIAAPVAWYFMHQWLQQYTYRIIMGAGFFITTIVCSLIIAWLTVSYTAVKAAIANPVTSLRSE